MKGHPQSLYVEYDRERGPVIYVNVWINQYRSYSNIYLEPKELRAFAMECLEIANEAEQIRLEIDKK